MANSRFLISPFRQLHKTMPLEKTILQMLLVLAFFLTGCARTTTFTVLDAETKEPIEGAVALAEWVSGRREAGFIGPTYAYTAKAVEAESDANGILKMTYEAKFTLYPPLLKVYKFGYVGWDSSHIYLGCYEKDRKQARTKRRENFVMKDQVIYLEPWKEEYSFISHHGFISTNANFREAGIKKSKYENAIKAETPSLLNEENSPTK